jgi:nitric oxide reductase subunit C
MTHGPGGGFTKQAARNIFYGGTVFFALLFVVLIFNTEGHIPKRSNASEITPAVARGKNLWETRNCIGCHTLLGEGAYYAPELGNVIQRRGGDFVKTWMKSMPTNAPGRRQMPQFHLNDQQLDDLVKFLEWTGKVDTNQWPPNIQG